MRLTGDERRGILLPALQEALQREEAARLNYLVARAQRELLAAEIRELDAAAQ